MPRLTGQKANGWAAALGRVQTRPQWQAASTIIDDARDSPAYHRPANHSHRRGGKRVEPITLK